jgi:hypothetical protein
MGWTWRYLGADGEVRAEPEPPGPFPSQSDAETWLGETWQELAEAEVDAVTLFEDGREVYGPMSLNPPE